MPCDTINATSLSFSTGEYQPSARIFNLLKELKEDKDTASHSVKKLRMIIKELHAMENEFKVDNKDENDDTKWEE